MFSLRLPTISNRWVELPKETMKKEAMKKEAIFISLDLGTDKTGCTLAIGAFNDRSPVEVQPIGAFPMKDKANSPKEYMKSLSNIDKYINAVVRVNRVTGVIVGEPCMDELCMSHSPDFARFEDLMRDLAKASLQNGSDQTIYWCWFNEFMTSQNAKMIIEPIFNRMRDEGRYIDTKKSYGIKIDLLSSYLIVKAFLIWVGIPDSGFDDVVFATVLANLDRNSLVIETS